MVLSNAKLAIQAALNDETTFHGSKHKCGETLRYVTGCQYCVKCSKTNARKWVSDHKEQAADTHLTWARANKTKRKIYHALKD
jgi:hypothetical protein